MTKEQEVAVTLLLRDLEVLVRAESKRSIESAPTLSRDSEVNGQIMGRVRMHLEAASEHLDRAFENVDIVGERLGL